MSRTSTMLSWVASNSASPITARTSTWRPRVSQASAFATRSGVFWRPSRSGSSPSSSSWRRTSISNSVRSVPADGTGDGSSGATLASGLGVPAPLPRRHGAAAMAAPSSSLPVVLDIVMLGFVEAEPREPSGRNARRQQAPARDHQVLARGVDAAEERDIHVHVAVVELADDLVLDDAPELAEVDHVARAVVHRAGDGHLELVIVPVPMRVVVPAEQGAILLRGERRIVEAVRRVDPTPACHGDHGLSTHLCRSIREGQGLVALPPVALAYRTISLPSMTGCSLQKYGSSPLRDATYWPLFPWRSVPVSHPDFRVAVAVCGTMSRLIQTTVSPRRTSSTSG